MSTILFLKARDRHDTGTRDMFGGHVETRTRKDGVVQTYHVATSPAPAHVAEPAIPDGHSKKYYVTMVRDKRVARLAGPFDKHEDALEHVEPARRMANKVDPFSEFDAFGTAGVTAAQHGPGTLNEKLGLSKLPSADGDRLSVQNTPAKAAPSNTAEKGKADNPGAGHTETASDHPAPIPSRSISHLPEAQRSEWADLHRQQHEIHYHEMGKTSDSIERLNKKLHDARKTAIQHRDEAKLARQHGLPGSDERADQHDRLAASAEDEAGKHYRKLDEVSRNHESLIARREDLGKRKDAILPGSGDLRTNMASGARTTLGEEREAAKRYRAAYVAHYKKSPAMVKAIVFLR